MLVNNKILTARLAVLIYRLALNLNTTTTHIGRYFHKNLGNKSKVINNSITKSKIRATNDLSQKSFKAYDLSKNDAEIAIRSDIAIKLLLLNVQPPLYTETIANITGLSKEEVDKLKQIYC